MLETNLSSNAVTDSTSPLALHFESQSTHRLKKVRASLSTLDQCSDEEKQRSPGNLISNHVEIYDEKSQQSSTPASPRVRQRLDNAKECASLYQPVCEHGEVVQWVTACHTDLLAFGIKLEKNGYRSLSSVAFLTREDIDDSIAPAVQQLLLEALSKLRHDLFRM